jgi:hypothetical protein
VVVAALEETMIRSCDQVHGFGKERKLPVLRTAAFLQAIQCVAESYSHHGISP